VPKVRFAGRIRFLIAWFLLIGAGLGAGQAARFSATAPAMNWNVNGEVWAAGTNATATRLP
jgi:hypothetical protein